MAAIFLGLNVLTSRMFCRTNFSEPKIGSTATPSKVRFHHDMETLPIQLAFCEGIHQSPVGMPHSKGQ